MLRPWIAKKVTEMIKFEDDVVVEYVFGMLEDRETPVRILLRASGAARIDADFWVDA